MCTIFFPGMKKYILLALIVFAAAAAVPAQDDNETDAQFWNETKLYFPSFTRTGDDGTKKKVATPFIMGTLRVGQNFRHFVSERIGFGVDIPLNKYLKFTPSYYYIAEQPVRNSKSFEHRLRFEVTAEKKWRKFSLSDRNRIEYRIRHSRGDSVRYRNKFKLKVPVRNDDEEIFSIFAATEPFYDFRANEFTRNELSGGIEKKFNKNATAEFFYMLQNNTGPRLRSVNIVGVNLKFTID